MNYVRSSLFTGGFLVFSLNPAAASEIEFLLTGEVSTSAIDALPTGTNFELRVSYDDLTSPTLEGVNSVYPGAILDASLSTGNGVVFDFSRNIDQNVIQTTTSNEPGDVVTMRFGDFANDAFDQEAYVSLNFPIAKSLLESSELTSLEPILAIPEFLDANNVLGRDFPSFEITDGIDTHFSANSSTLTITLVPEPSSSTLYLLGLVLLCCRARPRNSHHRNLGIREGR